MDANLNHGNCPVILKPSSSCASQNDGSDVEALFRFGCGYARLAKDGRHAWVIDLYQRKAIVTGKAQDIPLTENGCNA